MLTTRFRRLYDKYSQSQTYLAYWTAGKVYLKEEFPAVITRDPGKRDDARLKYVIDFDGVSIGT